MTASLIVCDSEGYIMVMVRDMHHKKTAVIVLSTRAQESMQLGKPGPGAATVL